MKVYPSSPSSSLISFYYLLLYIPLTIAAVSLVRPQTEDATLNNTSRSPNLSTQPHDPQQFRVFNTPTSLIVGKYTAPVDPLTLSGIVAKGLYEIVQRVVIAAGEEGPLKPNPQPTFEWRHGRMYIRMEMEHRLLMSWLTMAQALYGILDFAYSWGFRGCEFGVLDDELGLLGSGSVGMGYT